MVDVAHVLPPPVPPSPILAQIKLVQQLAGPLQQLQDAALSIAAITRDAGLECDDTAYLETFNPNLMDVFFNWSLGKSFAEVRAECFCR